MVECARCEILSRLLSDVTAQGKDGPRKGLRPALMRFGGLPRVYFVTRRYADFGRNSLLALTAIAPYAETEKLISELYNLAISDSVNPPALLQIIEAVSEIGAKCSSTRALDFLFKLVPRFYELLSPVHPIYHFRRFHLIEGELEYPLVEYEREFDLDKRLLWVAQKIEPVKAAREIKTALESSDDDPLTRERSWGVISQVYTRRGSWKSGG